MLYLKAVNICHLLFFWLICIVQANTDSCQLESCPQSSQTDYYHKLGRQSFDPDIKILWSWLKAQGTKHARTFCSSDKVIHEESKEMSNPRRPYVGPFKCPSHGTLTFYEGKLNKDNVPQGKGRINVVNQLRQIENNMPCYETLPIIGNLAGTFKKVYLYIFRSLYAVKFAHTGVQKWGATLMRAT